MILIGRRWLWHERWLDYRALAENLRHGRFLSFVSEFGRIRGEPAGVEQREPPWMLWYVRATMREIGLPNATLDGTYQWRLLNATLDARDRGAARTARLSPREQRKPAPHRPRCCTGSG